MAILRNAFVHCLMMTAAALSESSSTSLGSSLLAKTSLHEGLNTMVLRAREWLRTHEDPDQAGMDELKSTNPDAFAIVQALITKKSLGLLNPKHPNAFGGYDEAPGKGTMSTQVVDEAPQVPVAAMVTETQHTSHQDFFNWKPHEEDDVSSVLGDQPEPQKSSVAAPVESSNSYLKSTGPLVKSDAAAPPTASMTQENSYLNSAGLGPKHVTEDSSQGKLGNALASFSWNDDVSSSNAGTSQHATAAAQPKIPGGNALANFLR